MGVTGLWQIVQPCARPIKIETLNRKRLAVDASIWIYQFLKAVRDKEGNALRNSHVVGFFRRICKLLFFGIKPVFVFDGGAPALKRQTIRARKARREGRREDAVRTAGKLLAKQMQRRAEEEDAQRRQERDHPQQEEEVVPDEGNMVYVDELQMSQQERKQNRTFRKKDAYHLPDLDMSMSEMGGPNDPRVVSLEDLQEYARQFNTGEDINVYDFSKIDYDGQFFMSLPPSDRYNILNAARLRSRLRMGHSKEQLDEMFPDRMAFSKFQIDRVRERNELTQRLMHLNGSETMDFGGGRIAGEKGREYVLVKNDGVEGGWALGVISEEGREEKPIDVDKPVHVKIHDTDEGEDDDDFEDIPIEGLNRLPKQRTRNDDMADQLTKQRRAVYQSRRSGVKSRPKPKPKPKASKEANPLFVQSSEDEDAGGDDEVADEEWEHVDNTELFGDDEEEDEDLRKAIEMSMQKDPVDESTGAGTANSDHDSDDNMLEVFQQKAAEDARPVPKGSGRTIANFVNKRAFEAAPESREITSFGVPTLRPEESEDDEDTVDFRAALAESRRNKRKTSPPRRSEAASKPAAPNSTDIAKAAGFSGPLPFEKLDLGTSLLGKKKMQQRTEEIAGGFEKPGMGEEKQKKAEPLPPWFNADVEDNIKAQKAIEAEDREKAKAFNKQFRFEEKGESMLRRGNTGEVIDLDGEEYNGGFKDGEVIDLDGDDDVESAGPSKDDADVDMNMGDLADEIRAKPPTPPAVIEVEEATVAPKPVEIPPVMFQEDSDEDSPLEESAVEAVASPDKQSRQPSPEDGNTIEKSSAKVKTAKSPPKPVRQPTPNEDDEDEIDWSDSDAGEKVAPKDSPPNANDTEARSPSVEFEDVPDAPLPERSPSVEFEDVEIPDAPPPATTAAKQQQALTNSTPAIDPTEPVIDLDDDDDEFDDFSDPEEEAMLRALTLEAEEHARFASTLNHKPQAQNHQDYERELKQLRNQQKKDRRDADEVTHTMITECQALLGLFGLPYITAPMEAEAQCAELVRLGLVDGIVTDDSDCFLFGGTRIYKNMFNQAKFVECYLTSDLEKEFDLTRDKLISVAQLLGSDYTEGLPGVGPVTALEIISEFGSLDNFREWWDGVQANTITKADDASIPFRKKFRRNATKLFLPPAFPDKRVEIAYEKPEVDSDSQGFQWGVPDLDALRGYLMATIGWSQERTDEVLVPVIRDMNRRIDEGTQANITAFFDGGVGIGGAGRGEGFAARRRVEGSKRMGSALERMRDKAKLSRGGTVDEEVGDGEAAGDEGTEEAAVAAAPAKGQKKRKAKKAVEAPVVDDEDKAGGGDDDDFEEPQPKKTKRRARPMRKPKA